MVTVTGLGDGVDSELTIRANRLGYDEGVGATSGRSFEAPRNAGFTDPSPTADGFTVKIADWIAGGDGFTWGGSATETVDQVQIDLTSGVVTVTGVAPGTNSTVTITATKTNYVPGSGQTTVKSINGAAKVVTF